ncbi:hypothetical protein WMY93_029652 [Mugilogobius chulae]|uniref:Uncharacterized protein n=1 Tax=Mugilogobius chulae TaxID=88201 RepID=A0AAW0MSE0_9GOBI
MNQYRKHYQRSRLHQEPQGRYSPGPREEMRSRPNLRAQRRDEVKTKPPGPREEMRAQRRDEVKTKPPGPRRRDEVKSKPPGPEKMRSRPNLQGPEKNEVKQTSGPEKR